MSESSDTLSSQAGNRAEHLKRRIEEDGRKRVESGKQSAAKQMKGIADAIGNAGSQLGESQPTLANYASKLADGVGNIASRLREDRIEDLYRDARRLAARHPGMFILGSAAVGLAIARFMRTAVSSSDGADSYSNDAYSKSDSVADVPSADIAEADETTEQPQSSPTSAAGV